MGMVVKIGTWFVDIDEIVFIRTNVRENNGFHMNEFEMKNDVVFSTNHTSLELCEKEANVIAAAKGIVDG
jgi:hypothetical protein